MPFIIVLMQLAAGMPPPTILQIVREPLKSGGEAVYSDVEEELGRLSASLGCPHPYLGAESMTGGKEVWWFNSYRSDDEEKQVADAYARNTRLLTALKQAAVRKQDVTLAPIETRARYRPDWSVGAPWLVGHGRYLVVTRTTSGNRVSGTAFEEPDGTRIIIRPARTRREADAARALVGPEAKILAVRPNWSFPDKTWIAADTKFWQPRAKTSHG